MIWSKAPLNRIKAPFNRIKAQLNKFIAKLNIEIEILDLNGKLIANQNNDNTNSCFVNTNLLQSGLYIVRIKAEDVSFNEKLVVY